MSKLNCVICFGWMWLLKLLSVLLEKGTNQTAIWMVWASWVVSFALDGFDCSKYRLCSVQNKTNQTAIWMLSANWIVSFVAGGCDCSLHCQINSWRRIYLISLKFLWASPPNSIYFPLLSDSFLEAISLDISKIFGGFAPRDSIYLLYCQIRSWGPISWNFSIFWGLCLIKTCTFLYCQIRSWKQIVF